MSDLKYNFLDNNYFLVFKTVEEPEVKSFKLPTMESSVNLGDNFFKISSTGIPIAKDMRLSGDYQYDKIKEPPIFLEAPEQLTPEQLEVESSPKVVKQNKSLRSSYINYINKYKDEAIEQMNLYHIPASIILAQGLLETNAGQSRLAQQANNHFGIKGENPVNGAFVRATDDKPDEKFRKYTSAKESFEDHSKVLLGKRYRRLFALNPTDYKGWARGIKQAGYATSPKYAENLINIIETYNLLQYDKQYKKAN